MYFTIICGIIHHSISARINVSPCRIKGYAGITPSGHSLSAMTSTSTRTPLGRLFTATQERAGPVVK